jgi:hypothetical protein
MYYLCGSCCFVLPVYLFSIFEFSNARAEVASMFGASSDKRNEGPAGEDLRGMAAPQQQLQLLVPGGI